MYRGLKVGAVVPARDEERMIVDRMTGANIPPIPGRTAA